MKSTLGTLSLASLAFLLLIVTDLMRPPRIETPETEAEAPIIRLDALGGRKDGLFKRHHIPHDETVPTNPRQLVTLMLETIRMAEAMSLSTDSDDHLLRNAIRSMREEAVTSLSGEIERAATSADLAAAIVRFHHTRPITWPDSFDILKPVYVRAAFSKNVVLRDAARSVLGQLSPGWDSLSGVAW
jgi:hypothetical protein